MNVMVELKNKCEEKGYEFVCDEIKLEIRITNPAKGVVVLLTAIPNNTFAGGAIPISHLPKVLKDWEVENENEPLPTPLGHYVYELHKYHANHDWSLGEVMYLLENAYFNPTLL